VHQVDFIYKIIQCCTVSFQVSWSLKKSWHKDIHKNEDRMWRFLITIKLRWAGIW